jgi:hypothetical protein
VGALPLQVRLGKVQRCFGGVAPCVAYVYGLTSISICVSSHFAAVIWHFAAVILIFAKKMEVI